MSVVRPAASPAESLAGFTPPSRRGGQSRRIGDAIVELGFASREAVERAVELARSTGQTTGQALLDADVVTADQHARAVAERYGVDHVDLGIAAIDPAALALVDPAVLRRHRAVPVGFADEGRTLVVATADPGNVLAFDDLAMMTGLEVRRAVASGADLELLLGRLSRLDADLATADSEDEVPEPRDVAVATDEAPVVKLVHSIVADAVRRGASDVHFDPGAGGMRVRMRVDGVVSDTATVPRTLVAGLISRVKIMANLDIAERRLPQDGRIGLTVERRAVDIRVATLPTVDGEAVVMRVLDKSGGALALDRLGLNGEDLARLRAALAKMDGCVLATGPTGSGKTTTLYAALTEIDDPARTLITIEDPVEYELERVKQIQVNPRIGLDFAAGLRSMMRSDPDVMMVGEIRDSETARIAIQSALTGHLVLSTLHTTGAPHSVARLVDMGIEPFLVASGVSLVVAQRLARRLCDCAVETTVSADDLLRNGFAEVAADVPAREPVGCPRCGHTGYRGRVGLYELMEVSDPIRDRIVAKRSADAIAAVAVQQGMRRLRDDGLDKVAAGVTSLAEVLRVAGGP